MKFYQFDEKEKRIDIFNERWYLIDGEPYRNVTTILGIIDKGYAYDEWLKNVGHNAEIIVDRAGKLGTVVHRLIERTLLGDTVKYSDLDIYEDHIGVAYWERYLRWCAFWKDLTSESKVEYKPEGIEFICHSKKYKYAGTVDLVARVNGQLCIYDWKTGTSLHEENFLQVSAYMKALEEMFKEDVYAGYLVSIPLEKPNKAGYRVKEIENTGVYFDHFLSAKALHDAFNKEKPKFLSYPMEMNLDYIKNESIIKEK